MDKTHLLEEIARERILILDGAMGTALQNLHLTAQDFILDGAEPHHCHEVLSLTRPDLIYDIHTHYLAAGADIIETNTFGANELSLAAYQLEDQVYDLNLASAEIARAVVEDFCYEHEERQAFVAGVLGPTSYSASFSPRVEDPEYRTHTFFDFERIYRQQARALLDGGVDLLLVETVFDTLVAKAALSAIFSLFEELDKQVPVMVSATFSDVGKRTLSGQSLEAFCVSMSSYPLFSLGINCSLGPRDIVPLVRSMAENTSFRISVHPNAGLPNSEGSYSQSPEEFVAELAPLFEDPLVSIIGGCCGTDWRHIELLQQVTRGKKPRQEQRQEQNLRLSGWEVQLLGKGKPFFLIGERTNVAGSRNFERLIRQDEYSKALQVGKRQVEQGAMAIDLCMDSSLIDAPKAMRTFLRLSSVEPGIAEVPIVIDSSNWEVVKVALDEVQGRALVNSISLKEGEERFIEQAHYIISHGAIPIIMLFDEEGQAATLERKREVAQRSWQLLEEAGLLERTTVVIDPMVMAIATGIEEHDRYGRDFLDAVRWLKTHLPHAYLIGGISNISFSFRGNDRFREALNGLFLRLAIAEGLDMAIVNPLTLSKPIELSAEQEHLITEAILLENISSTDARQQLLLLAEHFSQQKSPLEKQQSLWQTLRPRERLYEAVKRGEESYLKEDLESLADQDPLQLIEMTLMTAMHEVGELFGKGLLYLPHVVKSTRVMKLAVDILKPRLEQAQDAKVAERATVVLATVRGDVHDIGKNIVSLVLQCNNFKVIDLGTMVDGKTILAEAERQHADLVALSALISPSLEEMAAVCRLFAQAGQVIPLLVGGATTSEEHTALKLHPLYQGGVVYGSDASQAVRLAVELTKPTRKEFLEQLSQRYLQICEHKSVKAPEQLSISVARERKFKRSEPAPRPQEYGIFEVQVELDELLGLINWPLFTRAWEVQAQSSEGKKLIVDAQSLLADPIFKGHFQAALKALVGFFPAYSTDEEIRIKKAKDEVSFHFPRQLNPNLNVNHSLADYLLPDDSWSDTVGLFVATAGLNLTQLVEENRRADNHYQALMVALLADRLAEAFSEYLERYLKNNLWCFGDLSVIRPAVGFPMAPEHAQKKEIFALLEAQQRIGVTLTETYAMQPVSSVCGFIFVGKGVHYFSL